MGTPSRGLSGCPVGKQMQNMDDTRLSHLLVFAGRDSFIDSSELAHPPGTWVSALPLSQILCLAKQDKECYKNAIHFAYHPGEFILTPFSFNQMTGFFRH